jgi:hypothetical protein
MQLQLETIEARLEKKIRLINQLEKRVNKLEK